MSEYQKYDDVYKGFAAINNKEGVDLKMIVRGHADYYEVMRVQRKIEERNSKLASLRPYERARHHLQSVIAKEDEEKYYLLTAYSLDEWPHRLYDLLKRTRLKHEAVSVVVALKHWQINNGSFPGKLEELVTGGYIKQIFEDPFSDGKIKYKRIGEDFLLYSNGYNMKDDNGSREVDEESQTKDLVFWPIAYKNTSTNQGIQ